MSEKLTSYHQEKRAERAEGRDLIVSKFGGTSVGSPDAINQVVDIVSRQYGEGNNVMVVVSAQNGVTNQLIDISAAKKEGNYNKAFALADTILSRHYSSLTSLELNGENFTSAALKLYQTSKALTNEVETGGNSVQDLDRLLSFGEKLNAPLISAALGSRIPAIAVDATKILVSDNRFSEATVDIDASIEKSQQLHTQINSGLVPVVTGFIASTIHGETTTLGRGGSDSSAAALARIFNANELHIFTDVDGVYSDDPNHNPDAFRYDELDFHFAQELAQNGAKVLYYNMFLYLRETQIPVLVKNTFAPDTGGTFIKPSMSYAA